MSRYAVTCVIAASVLMPTCSVLVAQEQSGRAGDEPASLSPGEIDTEASRVFVFVDRDGLGHVHGIEGTIESGTVHLGADQEAGEIVFDMASFTADTDAALEHTGVEREVDESEKTEVTATMRGDEVLDVETYPTATFRIDSAERLAEDTEEGHPRFALEGEFTLCGTTQPLSVVAVRDGQTDGKLHLAGDFTIEQTDYGIEPYSTAFGLVSVADELRIWGDLWLAAESAETP